MTLDITTLTNLLKNVLEPYIELLTFGIDIAAGIVIGVSAIIALEQTGQIPQNQETSYNRCNKITILCTQI